MPGKADELEQRYGDLLRSPPLSSATSARFLFNALKDRRPPLNQYKEGVVRKWWDKFGPGRTQGSDEKLNAKELETKHGALLRELLEQHPTAFKLKNALRARTPAGSVCH